ncbi:hypothetical protein BJF85_09890 [Saccharomonospora sp. CUA-673]|uniref:DUF6542 domain-containing protein n=1 Tax=Saccharomonospora sp. CUA-673 TaxID=1904969 RepID=UPI0009647739|nr:DUF6542 domain-containing protein [Saccharomonospora sp. CUA-673]OLT49178.1 hypothetical protein BJF85_09890 [Saccharomonospora sp. CUA-673]
MTATRDRQSDPDAANEDAPLEWDERPVIGDRRGLPWWGAVLLALITAVAGAVLATLATDGLGLVFQLIYLAGCLAAVAMVQRRQLFGPMVQPPLVMAVTVPVIVLTVSSLPDSNDTLANVLAVSTPLINSFPVMAIATVLTLGLGAFRIYRERDPDLPRKSDKDGKAPSDKAAKTDKAGGKDAALADDATAKGGKGKAAAKGAAAAGAAAGAGAVAAAVASDDRRGKDVPDADRPRRPRPPEDRGEPPRKKRPAGEAPPPRRPRGPEDGPPPRRPRPADGAPPPGRDAPPREGRRPRTPPDAAERKRRVEEWPDSVPGPKRPQRPPRGEQPPRGERPPRRDQPPRRPWDEDA